MSVDRQELKAEGLEVTGTGLAQELALVGKIRDAYTKYKLRGHKDNGSSLRTEIYHLLRRANPPKYELLQEGISQGELKKREGQEMIDYMVEEILGPATKPAERATSPAWY